MITHVIQLKMMMNSMNKYTTITAIVNSHTTPWTADMLERALKSVLEQDIEGVKWEVILVNDGKADNEIEAVARMYDEEFGDINVPFTFFCLQEPSGYQCVPKNTAIHHAKGEYISFLDYDNEWTPCHLRVLYNAIIEGNVWPDFTYGRREYIIDEGCDVEQTLPGGKKMTLKEGESTYVKWDVVALQRLANGPPTNFIDTSDFMTSKGAFWHLYLSTGMMWNEGYRRFADWELLARASHFGGWRGKGVDEVVNKYHWTGHNVQLTRAVEEVPQKRIIDDAL